MNKVVISHFKFSLVLLSMTLLISCGGGGNGGSPPPANNSPVADAGAQQDASRGFTVNLDGSASSDPDGDTLTYFWTQTHGPDVTDGSGSLSGETPSFTAPNQVSTIIFELEVSDGKESDTDSVQIDVFENVSEMLFVDGDNGSDDSVNGSRDTPFATISAALAAIDASPKDIYVMTLAASGSYDESTATLTIPNGTSLYGGYDANWVRDISNNRTRVDGHSTALMFDTVNQSAWLSGFDIKAADSATPGDSVYGLIANGGTALLYIEDNTIEAGDVATGTADNPGSSYGVSLSGLEGPELRRNNISAGQGGDGAAGDDGLPGSEGDDGAQADSATGVSGGSGAGGRNGGRGGNGGNAQDIIVPFDDGDVGSPGDGPSGGDGGAGGATGWGAGAAAYGEAGGGGLDGGDGENEGTRGARGSGEGAVDMGFVHGHGANGSAGDNGSGGGGGGGGGASMEGFPLPLDYRYGGGGGGGGGAGYGGPGSEGGSGGGASAGLWLEDTPMAVIEMNTITSGTGGQGAPGGSSGYGGNGGFGEDGSTPGAGTLGATPGKGGMGGNGGNGANGGIGGAGGGGPSYGILVGVGLEPTIENNTITSGNGGNGGAGTSGDFDSNSSHDREDTLGGHGGDGGASYAIYDANTNDDMLPSLQGNTRVSGAVGAPGSGGLGGYNSDENQMANGNDGDEGPGGNQNW